MSGQSPQSNPSTTKGNQSASGQQKPRRNQQAPITPPPPPPVVEKKPFAVTSFVINVSTFAGLILAFFLAWGLSESTGLVDKLPFTVESRAIQGMESTMPLRAIGYLSRDNGGPVWLLEDRDTKCHMWVVPGGGISPRLGSDGLPFCNKNDTIRAQPNLR